ncbi:amidohydrolase [Streptomyces tricolor]|nr:amidohydrolase [Streptomyces tricolor]
MSRPPTVDVHAHVLLPEVEALVDGLPGRAEARALEARRAGPAALAVSGPMVRARLPELTDPAVRLAAMDAQGVDVQLSVPPRRTTTTGRTRRRRSRCTGWPTRRRRRTVSAAPRRLRGLGLVPLQHPQHLVRPLDHALGQGLLGVEISSHAPGRELSDPAHEPLWTRAEDTGALVFLHPFGCIARPAARPVVPVQHRGQPVENAVALSHLIFSGVLDRHPGLKLIAAHGGGYLPTHIGRSDHAWSGRSDAGAGCARPPGSYLKRIYFDSPCTTRASCGSWSGSPAPTGCCSAPTSPSTWAPRIPSMAARGRSGRRRLPRRTRRQRLRPPLHGVISCVCSPTCGTSTSPCPNTTSSSTSTPASGA